MWLDPYTTTTTTPAPGANLANSPIAPNNPANPASPLNTPKSAAIDGTTELAGTDIIIFLVVLAVFLGISFIGIFFIIKSLRKKPDTAEGAASPIIVTVESGSVGASETSGTTTGETKAKKKKKKTKGKKTKSGGSGTTTS